jgi:hypothetical protein
MIKMYNKVAAYGVAMMAMLIGGAVLAGDLDSPAAPSAAGSAMFTLEDVYQRLNQGTTGTKRSGAFVEPGAGPGSTGHTLDETMAAAPAPDMINGARELDVVFGKTFWCLFDPITGEWGTKTGTAAAGGNVSGADGSLVTTITAGFYSGSQTATASDTDLVTGNIKAGANIFGVAGKTEVVDTTSGDAAAGDLLTGKKAWVDGVEVTGSASIAAYPAVVPKTGAGDLAAYTEVAGEDGHASVRKGVAWPNPRFTDNTNGTVTDNLTGLIWLKNANFKAGTRTWAQALTDCATLADGAGGLTDGSVAGDWRLPNVQELQSLIDYGRFNPALSNSDGTGQWTAGNPFTGVVSSSYWSSTTDAGSTGSAWVVNPANGLVFNVAKGNAFYVWPVRGGQ